MEAEGRDVLAGLGVLVPRPAKKPDTFSEMISAQGAEIYAKPVIDVVPAADLSPTRNLSAILEGVDAIIFVSSNAAEFFLAAMDSAAVGLPGDAEYFAVGRSTAETLVARGLQVGFPRERANSEGLLELPQLANVTGKKVVICRGEGGRDKLRTTLQDRGADVVYAELYKRVPTVRFRKEINTLIGDHRIQAVVIHSGEILDALLDCLDPRGPARVADLAFLVPGQRVAELLRSKGLKNVIVAANALPEKMVAALVHWYTER